MTTEDPSSPRSSAGQKRFSYQAGYDDGRVVEPYVGYEIFAGDAALGQHSLRSLGRVNVDPRASLSDAEFYPEACWEGAAVPTGAPREEPAAAVLGRLAESPLYDATVSFRTDRVMACRVEDAEFVPAEELVRVEYGPDGATCEWLADAVPASTLTAVQRSSAREYAVFLVDPRTPYHPVRFVRIVAASYRKKAVHRAVTNSFECSVGAFTHFSHALVVPILEKTVYSWSDEALAPYLPDEESRTARETGLTVWADD